MSKSFGFEILTSDAEDKARSFVPPTTHDMPVDLPQVSPAQSTVINFDPTFNNETEIINRYREMSLNAEMEEAVDDIIHDAIVMDDVEEIVTIDLEDINHPDSIKNKIKEEFEEILQLLHFYNHGADIFKRWYVDGRLYYHMLVDEKKETEGIQELRYIDPRKIRKIRHITKEPDPKGRGVEIITGVKEYYEYSPSLPNQKAGAGGTGNAMLQQQKIQIAKDSICFINSGIFDSINNHVLGHLHKAIKPLNMLRQLEDSLVIYRIARAPERRVFYVDVGSLGKQKAEAYVRGLMNKYRNKIIYDGNTGEIKDDRRHMAMTEDFWLPRREGGRGTEISTLPGGQNLGEMDDVKYFQKKLYRALKVPVSRIEPDTGFSIGRTTEITRDELRFQRFIFRLRHKFSEMFSNILRIQLILKRIINEDEWKELREKIRYKFTQDSYFQELKESDIMESRLRILRDAQEYVGSYYSKEWIRKKILHQTEDDIKEQDKQMKEEEASGEVVDDDDDDNGGGFSGFGNKNKQAEIDDDDDGGGGDEDNPVNPNPKKVNPPPEAKSNDDGDDSGNKPDKTEQWILE